MLHPEAAEQPCCMCLTATISLGHSTTVFSSSNPETVFIERLIPLRLLLQSSILHWFLHVMPARESMFNDWYTSPSINPIIQRPNLLSESSSVQYDSHSADTSYVSRSVDRRAPYSRVCLNPEDSVSNDPWEEGEPE